MSEPVLSMKGITKIYGNGILANDKVDFSVNAGEIHALMGENGAGKSTLMKMIFGIEHPDEGEIYCRGQKVEINSPTDALKLGIGMVHQHFMLVPSLSVAENMVLRSEPRKGMFLDMEKAVAETEAISQKYNLPIDARARVSDSVWKSSKPYTVGRTFSSWTSPLPSSPPRRPASCSNSSNCCGNRGTR